MSPSRCVSTILLLLSVLGCATTLAPALFPAITARVSTAVVAPPDSTDEVRAHQLLIRGLTHARLGNHERAVAVFDSALELTPGAPALLAASAASHAALGDYGTARLYLERAVDEAPANLHYRHELADMYGDSGQPDLALEQLETALEYDSTDRRTRRALVDFYRDRGERERARQHAVVLAEHHPTTITWDDMELIDGKVAPDLTARILHDLIARRSHEPAAYVDLAHLYVESDEPQRARDVVEAGLLQYPRDGELAALRADLDDGTAPRGADASVTDPVAEGRRLLEGGAPADTAHAADLLQRALAADPARPDVLVLLGTLYYEQNEFAEAADLLGRAADVRPRERTLWQRAAEAAVAADQPQRAAEIAGEGLLLFPGDLALLAARARAHLANDRFADAQRDADRALDLLGDDDPPTDRARFYEILGDALVGLGETADARAAWERALQLHPDAPSVRAKLQRL